MQRFIRSTILLLICSLFSACSTPEGRAPQLTDTSHYAARQDGNIALRAVNLAKFQPDLLRQRVGYTSDEAPGTIIVDTQNRFLYLIQEDNWALRYGVAIGRKGFGWTGEGQIARRAHWPKWTPPAEMIARDRSLEKHADGMPGGPRNPLGARALYVYQNGRDTLIRVHGTNTPLSIGHAASSGCFRMLNQDVIDLFNRVPQGAKIVVL